MFLSPLIFAVTGTATIEEIPKEEFIEKKAPEVLDRSENQEKDKVIIIPTKEVNGNLNSKIQNDPTKTEEYSKGNPSKTDIPDGINAYVNTSSTKYDVAVLIIDNNNRVLSSLSSEIASLYRSKGYLVTTSLFTGDFLNSKYLSDIQSANSRSIEKLGLAPQVNYIIIGKYSNEFDTGEMTKWISRATLDVVIVSCISKSQADAFRIDQANGYDDKQHAEKGAREKVVLTYKASHLNL